ncbi:MAG: hypothetical protein JWO13_3625 [Acidobacteriales bacterium]|nr:hypothetical protein [Terriglobales bacterium]
MTAQAGKPEFDAGHVPMTEEFDSPRRSLPPAVPVLVAAVVLGIAVFTMVRVTNPVTPASGAITKMFHVEQSTGDRVLVGIEVHLKNMGQKPVWVKGVDVKLTTPQGEFTDQPAPGVDHPRYLQAFPGLRQSNAQPLGMDTKIQPGNERDGLLIVAFPVNGDGFDKRQSVEVKVNFYDQKPLILKQ